MQEETLPELVRTDRNLQNSNPSRVRGEGDGFHVYLPCPIFATLSSSPGVRLF